MRRARRGLVLALAPLTAVVMAVSGCSGDSGGGEIKGAQEQPKGVNDINPRDPGSLKDGGDLRWPLDRLPDNFNRNQVDGTDGYAKRVMDALMPHAFRAKADGGVAVDTNYFESIELTSKQPQVVTYRINPKASWDDGTPITWEDLAAQARALSGTDPAFRVGSSSGYREVERVEKGRDDREAKVTFRAPYGEWRALFADLYPKSTNTDPAVFNQGWVERPVLTAGPFRVESVDRTGKTIILARNDRWWGPRPRLDRIVFRVLERGALPDALANKEIDFYEIGSNVDLFQRAKGIADVQIRQALQPKYNLTLFNGAPGSVFADPKLRVAVQRGINREVLTRALVGQILPDAKPLGNHVFAEGTKDYRDHSGEVGFDPDRARRELDELGWKAEGDVRRKDGRELAVRFVMSANNPFNEQVSKLYQDQLRQIGVKLVIQPVPSSEFSKNHLVVGNFDIAPIAWELSPFPIDGNTSVYRLANDVQQNYGRVGNDSINRLFEEAGRELDDARRAELANRIDEEVWRAGHSVPLYQVPDAVAVRSTLANTGAFGFADRDYTAIGFTG
ncbi:peptide/nickel transport system substrate-binding protein [Streptoalloteichus tenebrarius]|uniref:Peptide/nickel transport system substrate-binding protein n=1 Tax=Streptoalloteichus tenebrarius (strain ATCC 17920 / DSM 40477 / JCM 4838 / CBS 697.72 / NBRC 16177 / NCIMB 11028 / NRRL B-12390 / A12253. 1 / ISP 5477) TaxID=1933 RepID=A0ABT1HVV3_STRSD|nr:ABC transporter family substrate-binding protein [Streptoalloteichus tenebrarius]MCP2259654.1 peptide/nickel transport system substrate-binding protein [Streptoalloteichus tenebrarius]BFF00938.1 oligopeptide ABC transporter substrate-binding protein OppA [Streptoalloteichus tenebrarius]